MTRRSLDAKSAHGEQSTRHQYSELEQPQGCVANNPGTGHD